MELLERDAELGTLQRLLGDAQRGRGSVALVAGEAGIGKTTLTRVWVQGLADTSVHVGRCEDLLTPRVLGPLHEMARDTLPELADAIARADPVVVAEALLEHLDHPLRPTVVVVEDVHWADEATLDVLRYVGRRVADRRGIVLLTYREDAIGPYHPLTPVLAAMAGPHLHRLPLAPLSVAAIGALAAPVGLDGRRLRDLTGGNPFFVSEVLRAPDAGLPPSVAEAVLARLRDLPGGGREALEVLSVVPGASSLAFVEALLGDVSVLAEPERRGLVDVGTTVAFRHELGRRAVESALTSTQRLLAHRRVLAALSAGSSAEAEDASRIVHHAADARVVEHGTRAVDEAYRADAHREAVALGELVLARSAGLDPVEHARLLEQHAWALYNVHRFTEAHARAEEAVELRRGGDPVAHARALLTRSRMAWMSRRRDEALALVEEAAGVGAGHGPEIEAEIALHRGSLLTLTMQYGPAAGAVDVALDLSRRTRRADLEALALNYRGIIRAARGDPAWTEDLVASLELARSTGNLEARARGYTNLIEHEVLTGAWDDADRRIAEALPFLDDHGFAAHRFNVATQQAMLLVRRGRWAEAAARVRSLESAVEDGGILDALALNVRAHLVVRRGDPDADVVLAEAWTRAMHASASHYIGPIAPLPIEHAWLSGDPADVPAWVEATRDVPLEPWCRAEIARFARFAGHAVTVEGPVEEVWQAGLAGDWRRAAALWEQRGDPYMQALELADSGDEAAMLEALARLDRLGAAPAARMVRSRLRSAGMRQVPRGQQQAARSHPAGLTPRQQEVLDLLVEGLTNAAIADRLVVSVRTVDHHVAAILDKLGVASRQEAAARAAEFDRPAPGPADLAAPQAP
jgi:DNA-binding CsgD family transcriptional regulator